jgi:membrane protein
MKKDITGRLRNRLKKDLSFLYHVIRQVDRHDCLGMAAEIAFQLIFAFIQAILLAVAILSMVAGDPDIFNSIIFFLGSFLPLDLYTVIRNQIAEIAQASTGGIFTIGLLGTIWTMSTLMWTLKKSLQRSYHIRETRSFWKVRLIAFVLSIVATLLIAIVLNLLIFGIQIARFIERNFEYANTVALLIRILRIPVAFMAITFLASLLFWTIPNVKQRFLEIIPGALFFSVLWFLFTNGFGHYLRNFHNFNTTYGTLGAGLVLMIWMYLTALSFLIGGEVNAELHRLSNYENRA